MRLAIWSLILKVSVAHFYRHMPIIVLRLQSSEHRFLHYVSTQVNRGSASSCLWENSDSKLLLLVIWNLNKLFLSDKSFMFRTDGACQCQLFLRVILNYESSRQFHTLLHHISFVLYYLFYLSVCLFALVVMQWDRIKQQLTVLPEEIVRR